MRHCKKCLIPDQVPEVVLDAAGICNYCASGTQHADVENQARQRRAFEADLEETLRNCRSLDRDYHCLVPFSGGKDSCLLLYKLKVEYGLKVLAFTVNINLPGIAYKNIKRTLEKLDIDHVSYSPSPSFLKALFRHLLQNQEERGAVYTVSYVYAPLFEGEAIKIALQKNIPLVLAGYSPGQPEPDRMLYEFSRKLITQTDWTPPELKKCGSFNDAQLEYFFNPLKYPRGTDFPRYLAPFHAWSYDQDQIMKQVVELGLVATSAHASPIFSNYPINWLLMYSDLKNFGYNPYAPEFSALIREGKASLTYWKIMAPFVDFMIRNKVLLGRNVSHSLKWLGLSADQLHITLPRGAYDPVIL
ncbi:hypothetical protein [Methylococcus sp. EFPC2]|uniref:hypothetical protein n=1 Tax=Methylococcus sp. EFPC2 TaxID=2812648 RepID=UPI0019683D9F|nr:hypothetical protein [Methylococcus sp. EFPC2]QSA95700.1 hypothetical protein JWZ97_10605 [Methylococcus sp. EFPC2]